MSCLCPKVFEVYSTLYSTKKITRMRRIPRDSLYSYLSENPVGKRVTLTAVDRDLPLFDKQINLQKNAHFPAVLEQVNVVDCGHCSGCAKKLSTQWANRIELDITERGCKSYFCTFTLSDNFLYYPHFDHKRIDRPSINLMDLSHITRGFRRYKQFDHMQYYVSAEYGAHSGRPHYHAILWNCDGLDSFLKCDVDGIASYDPVWSKGRLQCIETSDFSALRYVTGYAMKKLSRESLDYSALHIQPEIDVKSPGIGRNYYLSHFDEILDNNGRITLSNGRVMTVDRYFLKLCESVMHLDKHDSRLVNLKNSLGSPNNYLLSYPYDEDDLYRNLTYNDLLNHLRGLH